MWEPMMRSRAQIGSEQGFEYSMRASSSASFLYALNIVLMLLIARHFYDLYDPQCYETTRQRLMWSLFLSRHAPQLVTAVPHASKSNISSTFPLNSGLPKARPRSIVKCHALCSQRHPQRQKEKAREIDPSVAFQEETKPYGMKN
jgi:hypothetical protein